MTILRPASLALALCVAATAALAQTPGAGLPAPVLNEVQLSASGTVEVAQDLLTISMNTTREGADAATVQAQLKIALDTALAEARKAALPGQMDVRTGPFNLGPRYGRDGKISGWRGAAELVLEGRDFVRISTTAGQIQTLTVGAVGFGLSRDQRERVEGEAQALAIGRFKAKATDIARGFGFEGYALKAVTVSASDTGLVPRPRMMALEARAAVADAPVPVEAGKSSVVVTVSGAVQLR